MKASVLLAVAVLLSGALQPREVRAMQVAVQTHERTTLYHSPQTPGYTCWVGLWTMPDGSVMASFTQATGPVEGWRPRAPGSVLAKLPTAQQEIPAYDFTGLSQANIFMRSQDGGRTWVQVASQPFASALNGFCTGGVMALADGTILRLGWGQSLTYSDLRPTGFLQRSTDGAQTWEAPEYFEADPHVWALPTRLHRLRDGRLLLTGGVATPFDPDNWHWMELLPRVRHCLWISDDPQGRTWSAPLMVTPDDAEFCCEEWDSAELDDGGLLAVFRGIVLRPDGSVVGQDRRQSVLQPEGGRWRPEPISLLPLPHDGHPELLRMREGAILYVSPSGIFWTDASLGPWARLDCPGTAYYPRAVQLADGTVLAAGHTGGDDAYGRGDQTVVLDRYRLEVSP
jgi:hypothetical protein